MAFKTAMNVSGWIIAFMFYTDFQSHCEYMEVFERATPEEILEAEFEKCEGLSSEYCKQVRSEIEMEEEKVRE